MIGITYTVTLIALTIWWRPGWRRFAVITVTGPVRDYFEADRWFNIMRFGPGILPIVWDLFAWLALLSIIIVVNEKIGGPSHRYGPHASVS